MRVFAGLAIFAVLILLTSRALDRSTDAAGGATSAMDLPAGTPPELAGVFNKLEGARRDALGSVTGFLPGGGGDDDGRGAAAAQPEPPFADSGPRRRIAAVKRAVRRTLARGELRRRVLAWQGVIVSGGRAVVRADLEEVVVLASGTRMNRLGGRVTIGLVAEKGWQVVTVE